MYLSVNHLSLSGDDFLPLLSPQRLHVVTLHRFKCRCFSLVWGASSAVVSRLCGEFHGSSFVVAYATPKIARLQRHTSMPTIV